MCENAAAAAAAKTSTVATVTAVAAAQLVSLLLPADECYGLVYNFASIVCYRHGAWATRSQTPEQ